MEHNTEPLQKHVLNVPVLPNSHLQHQTVPLLQVHREQRRSQVSAEGPRTEEDPTGDRRYTVRCSPSEKAHYTFRNMFLLHESVLNGAGQLSGHMYSVCSLEVCLL